MAVQLNYDEINKRRKASGTTGVSNVSGMVDASKLVNPEPTKMPTVYSPEQEQGFDALRKQYELQDKTPAQASEAAGITYTQPIGQKTEQIIKPEKMGSEVLKTTEQIAPVVSEEKIKSVLPEGLKDTFNQLTPEKKQYYSDLQIKGQMETAIKELQEQKKQADELIYGKEIGQAMTDLQGEQKRQEEMRSIKASQNIQQAQDKLQSLTNNANYFRGAVGFPETQKALSAQNQQLSRAQKLVDDITQLEELNKQGLADEFSTKMRELQENLELNVNREVQNQLVNLNLLASTGKLDSVESIQKARKDILDTLSNKYTEFVSKNLETSKFLMEQAENRVKEYNESRKFDSNITSSMGDGYLYNALGQKMTDSNGMPIKGQTGKKINSTIDNKDGTFTVLYQDGSYESIKAGQDVSKVPDAGITNLFNTNYVYDRFGNIITDASGQPMTRVKEPTAGEKPQVVYKEDAYGNKVPGYFDPNTKEFIFTDGTTQPSTGTTGATDLRATAYKYPNEASLKNNNPAGITYNTTFANTLTNAGIQFTKGTSRPTAEGGAYFSFPSIEEGFKAYNLLWNSPSYTNLTVGQALKRWGTGALPGVDTSKKVSALSESEKEQLQMAQLKKESPGMYKELTALGIFGPSGINFPEPTVKIEGTKQYTATDMALFDKFLSGKDTEADQKKLRRLGYTESDINAYNETKPKTKELTDDQRVVFNSQLSQFRGNQVVKDYESMIGQTANIISSIDQDSGPGDIAAVYQFMKVLDPTSVVRETEFSTAASSAGLAGKIGNMFTKLESGEMLTDEQKGYFKSLMKEYVKNKSKQYDRLYDDMARVTKLSGVPDEYLPARASAVINETKQTKPKNIFDEKKQTNGTGTTSPVTGKNFLQSIRQ